MSFDPRKNAFLILNRLESSEKTLDAIMDDFHDAQATSSKRDRALMQALVFGVLRHRRRIDKIIGHFSNTGLRKIKPNVLNILRLGIFQIVYMDRIPNSAAVNTSVEMSKGISAVWTVRFVNAILRKVSASPLPTVSGPDEEFSIPDWLYARWIRRFGKKDTLAICSAVNDVPPITIRTNTLRTSRAVLVSDISEHVSGIVSTKFSPEGISFHAPKSAVTDLPGFADGHFQVQDEAAQLTSHILSPRPGETVLDACSGLGGKTGHIAQLMENRGVLYAIDREKWKLESLENEMARLGISIVTTCHHDLSCDTKDIIPASFDRILLDAPCSGLGVIRRNPDTKWRASKKNLEPLHQTQCTLLNRLAPLLKPSGVLVYAVCSTEPEENESVISHFLKTNPDFTVDKIVSPHEVPEECITKDGFFKTYPYGLSMDGFFAARFRKS